MVFASELEGDKVVTQKSFLGESLRFHWWGEPLCGSRPLSLPQPMPQRGPHDTTSLIRLQVLERCSSCKQRSFWWTIFREDLATYIRGLKASLSCGHLEITEMKTEVWQLCLP